MLTFALIFITTIAASQKNKAITDGKSRLAGFELHKTMKTGSAYKGLDWQFIGPANVSGRVTDVAVVSPKGKSSTIYAAAASGGMWKTENEGTTWIPIFDQEASTSIGDIAITSSDPDLIWVGTGEANIFRSSMSGSGVYKSLDGGKTWAHMGLANTSTIARIIIHPDDPDVVYVAASGHEWTRNKERGIFKTTDGGLTWKKVLYINDLTGGIDIVMDPEDPNTLYAAMWQRIRDKWNDPRNKDTYSDSGIYKTTDSGNKWIPVNNGLPQPKYRGRIGIDIAQTNPNVLYAFVDNYEFSREFEAGELDSYGRPKGGVIKGATVYRTDDKGISWLQVSGKTAEMKAYMEKLSATYGWVFGQIRVDPTDENTIYVMGLGLNVSTDGGKTFKLLRGMHGDHHGLWIDPDNANYLVNANDGGLYVSYDKGINWRNFQNLIPVIQFFNIGYDMDIPFNVYGSIQDHGSRRGIVDLSRGRDKIPAVNFEGAPGGEGSSHAIDPTNPKIVYSAGFYGHLYRTDLSKGLRKGSKYILPRQFPDEPKLRGQWVAPFIISPHDPNTLYHGMQYVFRSVNRGDTWERISPDLSYNSPQKMGDIPYQTVFALSESPLKFGLIYAGTDDGRLHVTKNGGKNWSEIVKGIAPDRWISRVEASGHEMGTVYICQNGKRNDDYAPYIWKSTDFGNTWEDISANIPLGPVNVIREDPIDKNILYVGTDIGVYVSKDQGKSWSVLGDLPSTFVHDLIIHPRDNIIVLATHGRGMWAMDANLVNGGREDVRNR